MAYQRTDRLAEEIQREVDDIIRHELNDPRIDGTYSITRVEVTRDLRYAKVFVSILEVYPRSPVCLRPEHCLWRAYRPGAF